MSNEFFRGFPRIHRGLLGSVLGFAHICNSSSLAGHVKKQFVILVLLTLVSILCFSQDPSCDGTGSCPKATPYDPPMICGGVALGNHYCGWGFCKFYCSISYGHCSDPDYDYSDAANSWFDDICLGPIGKLTAKSYLNSHSEFQDQLVIDVIFPNCRGGYSLYPIERPRATSMKRVKS